MKEYLIIPLYLKSFFSLKSQIINNIGIIGVNQISSSNYICILEGLNLIISFVKATAILNESIAKHGDIRNSIDVIQVRAEIKKIQFLRGIEVCDGKPPRTLNRGGRRVVL